MTVLRDTYGCTPCFTLQSQALNKQTFSKQPQLSKKSYKLSKPTNNAAGLTLLVSNEVVDFLFHCVMARGWGGGVFSPSWVGACFMYNPIPLSSLFKSRISRVTFYRESCDDDNFAYNCSLTETGHLITTQETVAVSQSLMVPRMAFSDTSVTQIKTVRKA